MRYEPLGEARATIVALHGFNDRKAAFLPLGTIAADAGVRLIAYDQGGFGANAEASGWVGTDQLVADLWAWIEEARRLSPGRPVFVLGESMGAAIAMSALARPGAPSVDGLILAAPGVWAGDQLNPLFRATLALVAATIPDLDLSAEDLEIQASDNIPMLIALGRDPLYLPTAKARALYGLVTIMDRGLEGAPNLTMPRLVLIGARDEVVPPRAFEAFLDSLVPADCTVVRYPDGWHLLFRDLERRVVIDDVLAWLDGAALPSEWALPCAAVIS